MEKNKELNIVDSSPAAMIKDAVKGGADLEKLEKLLELQIKWEANEAMKAYHKAMAAFKQNPPVIEKDKTVAYKEVKYNHASLANVVLKITAELSKHGLSAHWTTKQNGAVTVTCKITHVLGHSEETTLTAQADTTGSKNPIQAMGSTLSYLQRYTLLSATGLATSEMDNDAQAEVEYISEKQLSALLDILDNLPDSKIKKKKFLDFMQVESFEKIRSTDFEKAKSLLVAAQKRGEE